MTNLNPHIKAENFCQITDWLYRGGQPQANDLILLKEMQIKTILSLRWKKKSIIKESQEAFDLGMNFVSIPLTYWSWPKPEIIEQFLAVLDNNENHPIFIHCYHGVDRTGLVIALYRVARCGWTVEAAYQEMVERGFHKIRVHHFKWALWLLAKKLGFREP